MISPLMNSNAQSQQHNQHRSQAAEAAYRERLGSTPSGDLQNLRLQSCSNLLVNDSPATPKRSTR